MITVCVSDVLSNNRGRILCLTQREDGECLAGLLTEWRKSPAKWGYNPDKYPIPCSSTPSRPSRLGFPRCRTVGGWRSLKTVLCFDVNEEPKPTDPMSEGQVYPAKGETPQSPAADEGANDERRLEEFGGDDPHAPSERDSTSSRHTVVQDPDKVVWADEDPENPDAAAGDDTKAKPVDFWLGLQAVLGVGMPDPIEGRWDMSNGVSHHFRVRKLVAGPSVLLAKLPCGELPRLTLRNTVTGIAQQIVFEKNGRCRPRELSRSMLVTVEFKLSCGLVVQRRGSTAQPARIWSVGTFGRRPSSGCSGPSSHFPVSLRRVLSAKLQILDPPANGVPECLHR